MLKLIIFSLFIAKLSFGQDLKILPEKHRKLFESIEVPKLPGTPLLSSDIEKLRINLSLEVLSKINSATVNEASCIVNDLTNGKPTSRHLKEISEMFDRYEYHESGYIPCKAHTEILSAQDLKSITEKLWKNNLLKNEFPSGYCRGRAFLTSKILDDMGFKSKNLVIKRGKTILAAYRTKDGFRLDSYLDHFANIVTVKENGINVEYVIDPMFAESPVKLNDYLKFAAFPGETLSYEIKHQSYADKLSPPLNDETCKYNVKLLKDYEDAIQDSLKNPPAQISGDVFKTPKEAKDAYIKTISAFDPSVPSGFNPEN